jgi:hypothetical protein
MKRTCSIRFDVVFKNILMWDHFYMVVFDTTRPLLMTSNGNTYILVAIDHYSN